MRFKIDENLPLEFAEILCEAGHDAVTVLDEGLGGSADDRLFPQASQEGRALITLDLDFADLRVYSPDGFPGIIVFRVRRQDKPHLLETLRGILPMIGREPLENRLWIVEEQRVRIRGG